MKKFILFILVFLLLISFSEAKIFSLSESVNPPSAGCSIFGCTFMGDIDMNGYIIYNATFVNATLHEFDPVFTAENMSIWFAIDSKLNITDQRYNDTAFIINQLLNYYNKSEIDDLFNNFVYNETDPIFTAENFTIWQAINDKLDKNDQRYNDTQFILNQLLNYYNKSESDARYYNISNPSGYINQSQADLLYLQLTDQRYNETLLILDINSSLYITINDINTSLGQEILARIGNDSYIINWTNTTFYPLSNPAGYINESYANNSFYPLFSNPAGYINLTYANDTFYPRYDNPSGYLTNDTLNNVTGPWVLKAGDNMTGHLNMTNNSIFGVDVLEVHNITGRSPIYVSSEIISADVITANTFYGNINGANGTIYGMTIQNGTITNMHVSDSAIFNTSLLPEMNNTWSLGEGPDKYWKSFYVVDLIASNITSPDIDNLYNITYQIMLDLDNKLNITDQRYNETLLIYSINQTLYGDLYNETQARINNDSYIISLINSSTYNDTAIWLFVYTINQTLYQEIQDRINNDTYLQLQIDNKLNITDQRYNDTYLADEIWIYRTKGVYSNYTYFNVSSELNGAQQYLSFENNLLDNLNNYDAADIGTPNITYSNGVINQSLNITDPGVSQTVSLNDASLQPLKWTFMFWVNVPSDSGNPYIYYRENAFAGSWGTRYILYTGGNYQYTTEGNGAFSDSISSAANTNQWYHLAGTYNNDTKIMRLYLDGVEVANTTKSGDPYYGGSFNTTFGKPWWAAGGQYAYIDEYIFFDRELNTSEISFFYNGGNGVYFGNLSNSTTIITNTTTDFYTFYFNETKLDNKLQPIYIYLNNLNESLYNETIARIANDSYLESLINSSMYNDTLIWDYVYYLNESIYNETQDRINNDSYLQSQIDNKLNISDQRYNDTQLILDVNTSVWNELVLKLNITDQRYNDTQFILNELMNYYNITEIDTLFTYYYNKTEVDGFLDLKLNITDQRYNDTGYIDYLLTFYYNSSEVNYLLSFKLNESDQRYNDTQLILGINNTLYQELALKLNITDQRYNDTLLIYAVNQSLVQEIQDRINNDSYLQNQINYINLTTIKNSGNQTINGTLTIFGDFNVIGNIVNLTVTQGTINGSFIPELNGIFDLGSPTNYWNNVYANTLYGYLDASYIVNPYWLNITDQRYNDTYLISIVNQTIWLELDNKLNITDQRYNDTYLISLINQTLAGLIANETLDRINNDSYLQLQIDNKLNITDQRYNDTLLIYSVNATIKQPTGPYLAYDNTSFWVNESALNYTINNISKVRKVIYNMTCTTISGTCSIISTINITHLITEIKVIPTTPTNSYKFQLTEYPIITNIIDKDRATHVGTWDIEKNYAINGQVQANITNSNIDELFTISIIYLTNGVQ